MLNIRRLLSLSLAEGHERRVSSRLLLLLAVGSLRGALGGGRDFPAGAGGLLGPALGIFQQRAKIAAVFGKHLLADAVNLINDRIAHGSSSSRSNVKKARNSRDFRAFILSMMSENLVHSPARRAGRFGFVFF